ncbi:thiol peroxidase [Arcanobacterium wilhelmae]|uniref:Thiol peroxidase n=1 Tax=Arcanobacterium wilhelmae TaxID=1803177 RepID=A0ABT9NAB6_9ACTO|nr:thiol peroxidase [Arcanobacterium wilhelmae]MDP9800667.1 thiol peroxidase [Arcanobacterium wilhelmae]WFN90069.1 thiol peroxidase [Arcanobacterium wilhelmae]
MTQITIGGNAATTVGSLPEVGSSAPDFTLVGQDLADLTLADFAGQRVVLNIFPSLDTSTCAASVRRFNQLASSLDNTVVLCVSMDLPFAASRFCVAEGLEDVLPASAFRSTFGEDYGVTLEGGAFAGLLSRAVVVLDEAGKVVYTEQVAELTEEPDYDSAVAALK